MRTSAPSTRFPSSQISIGDLCTRIHPHGMRNLLAKITPLCTIYFSQFYWTISGSRIPAARALKWIREGAWLLVCYCRSPWPRRRASRLDQAPPAGEAGGSSSTAPSSLARSSDFSPRSLSPPAHSSCPLAVEIDRRLCTWAPLVAPTSRSRPSSPTLGCLPRLGMFLIFWIVIMTIWAVSNYGLGRTTNCVKILLLCIFTFELLLWYGGWELLKLQWFFNSYSCNSEWSSAGRLDSVWGVHVFDLD